MAYAQQNIATHYHSLGLLYKQDKRGYMGVIDMLRNNPTAMAHIKQPVRDRFALYSDHEIEDAAKRGISLRQPGVLKSNDDLR